jgi:hypothetical protein
MRTWLCRGLMAFLLLIPYRLERKEDGGFTLCAVLYELDCHQRSGKPRYTLSFLKILERQWELLRKLSN